MKAVKYIVLAVFAFFAVGMLDPVVAARIQALLMQIVYF